MILPNKIESKENYYFLLFYHPIPSSGYSFVASIFL
ncbi:hypothetical protein T01_13776 [Trichinella spiralis]|uniref:Uncharacterized protein n=1 Tax=Trichinella spiralis TaxID=6334 RepID=A0A0V0Z296_TRISP|nr:hypothetical protein T01_13776 [Trichinella spiralis]